MLTASGKSYDRMHAKVADHPQCNVKNESNMESSAFLLTLLLSRGGWDMIRNVFTPIPTLYAFSFR